MVVLPGIDANQLSAYALAIRKSVRATNWKWPIASIGQAYSFAGNVKKAIEMAEKDMYENKSIFYAEYKFLKR